MARRGRPIRRCACLSNDVCVANARKGWRTLRPLDLRHCLPNRLGDPLDLKVLLRRSQKAALLCSRSGSKYDQPALQGVKSFRWAVVSFFGLRRHADQALKNVGIDK